MFYDAGLMSPNTRFTLSENGQLVVRVLFTDVESDQARTAFMQTVEEELEKQSPQALVFDVAGLSVISSSVIGNMLRFRKIGYELWFRNASAIVIEMLERTNLIQVIGIQRDGTNAAE